MKLCQENYTVESYKYRKLSERSVIVSNANLRYTALLLLSSAPLVGAACYCCRYLNIADCDLDMNH